VVHTLKLFENTIMSVKVQGHVNEGRKEIECSEEKNIEIDYENEET
jgi:hypothetical protein